MNALGMRRVVVWAIVSVVMAAIAARSLPVAGQSGQSKLTTVLADLARSAAQDPSALAPLRTTGAKPVAVETLPPSVQDAVHGGWLQINARDEVQVYILVNALTDDTVNALTAAGVTIELQDGARRRVQARIPVSRLHVVAGLPIILGDKQ